MRNVVLYIAMSLDGYIADSSGNVDTYSSFIRDIDTVIMGWNTYHQVTTELSPDEWDNGIEVCPQINCSVLNLKTD